MNITPNHVVGVVRFQHQKFGINLELEIEERGTQLNSKTSQALGAKWSNLKRKIIIKAFHDDVDFDYIFIKKQAKTSETLTRKVKTL